MNYRDMLLESYLNDDYDAYYGVSPSDFVSK